ncbi:MAG: hypothetical protein WC708_17380, partial [Lentisphaeria bacterium]
MVILMKRRFAFLACVVLCGTALACGLPPSILNPATYVSSSGEYSLWVNPRDLYGNGPADYRFTKHGATLWSKRLPFTLWEAGVANSGVVAGYAYSRGRDANLEPGTFSAVILSPEGNTVARDAYPRKASNYLEDFTPNPVAEGMILDEPAKRLVLRIADSNVNQGIEQWWVYDLGSGKRIDTLEPKIHMADVGQSLSIIAARAVPSTPFILIHWWKADLPHLSGVFSLVDRAGKPVWTLTLDDDYRVPADDAREDEILRLIWKDGGILAVGTGGTFDLHGVRDGLRFSYAVEKQANGKWTVRKTAQTPYVWPPPASKPVPLPVVSLKKLGEAALEVPRADEKPQIREVEAFEFDHDGAICVLRAGRKIPSDLLLVSQRGDVLKQLRLPIDKIPDRVRFSNPANVGARKFVVSVSSQDIGGTAQLFLADFTAGTVRKMEYTACPCVEAIAGFPDGRFAALTTRRQKYSMLDGIFFFDAKGKLLWSKEQDGDSRKPDELQSPVGIIRCGTNEIALLNNCWNTIQIFDANGKFLRTLDLAKAWGRKPNYPTDIAADHAAGFLVYDFHAKQTLLRLDANGAILAASVPRLADGRPLSVRGGVKRSPQGALWTSDGDSLFRLSANSTVDLILGASPAPAVLAAPNRVEVGPDDRVYVADRRTQSVHVFAASGKHLGQCVPAPEDLTESSDINHLVVARDGSVYFTLDHVSYAPKYLHFDNGFGRVGWAKVDVDKIRQEWYFQPTADLCWIVGYHDLFLVRGREVVRQISRRADGRWLEYPDVAAVACDGSLAVLADLQGMLADLAGRQGNDLSVTIYGDAGDARSTFRVPSEPRVAGL